MKAKSSVDGDSEDLPKLIKAPNLIVPKDRKKGKASNDSSNSNNRSDAAVGQEVQLPSFYSTLMIISSPLSYCI